MSNPKKISPLFSGKIINGKIVLDTPVLKKRFEDRLKSLEGRKILLSINRFNKKRSLNQNNYYWGAIIPIIVSETGMLDEEVHEALRFKFLRDNTKKIPTVKSTADLSKNDFMEYLDNIQMWGTRFLGIEKWPDPKEWELRGIYDL